MQNGARILYAQLFWALTKFKLAKRRKRLVTILLLQHSEFRLNLNLKPFTIGNLYCEQSAKTYSI